MSKKKKINPRSIPCSKAGIDKAIEAGSETAQKISVFVLRNYMGFTDEDVLRFCKKFNETLDSINCGYCTREDIESVMMDEYRTRVTVK